MNNTARRVHKVHLTAPSNDLVWRGQRLLEDALHTASFPAADTSELLFIRQLNVGTIHSGQSATTLSLSLESKLQQMSEIALPGTHPAAARAAAVTFPDDLTALTHFAHRLTMGQPLTAWFWPHLLPSWHPNQSTADSFRHLLSILAAHALAPFATATVLQQLHQRQSLLPLLKTLQPQDGISLLAEHNWKVSFSQSPQESAPVLTNIQTALLTSALECHWTQEDPRTLWLAAMGLIAQQPTLTTEPQRVVDQSQHIIRAYYSQRSASSTQQHSPENISESENNPSSDLSSFSPLAPAAPRDRLQEQAQKQTQNQPQEPTNKSATSSTTNSPKKTTFTGEHTDYAGLIYLLNILQYLHLPAYLPKYNHPHFPHTLLRYTAHRLQIPPEDPILTACTPPPHSPFPFPPFPFTHSPFPHSPIPPWHAALRTYSRRHTNLTLKSLIHRPGIISLTPTHLDVTFDLNQIDIRIRKAGLDLNPGWLPWFGKVVQFHYEPSQAQGGSRP